VKRQDARNAKTTLMTLEEPAKALDEHVSELLAVAIEASLSAAFAQSFSHLNWRPGVLALECCCGRPAGALRDR